MTGVVLCGGQSTRMGTDKGLIKQNDITWARSAFDKLSSLDIPVVLSVNARQVEQYLPIFHPSLLVKDSDRINIKGPLCGAMSVHVNYPAEDLLLLACDMPFMETYFLKQLVDHRNRDHSFEAYLFSTYGEPEPLCGVYSANGLARILRMHDENGLIKHSMKFAIDQLHPFFIPLKDGQQKFFMNINTHADLNGL